MIVSQAEIDEIRSARIRRRTLLLDVRFGEFGERKRCPMRVGHVYRLTPRVRPAEHRTLAEVQPTRARAVIAFIGLCESKGRDVTITVRDIQTDGRSWIVSFEKGSHDVRDQDIFLCRDNDFTMSASRQTVRGDPPYTPPFAEDLRRAREKAAEGRAEPNRSSMAAMRAAHRRMAVRKHTMTVAARRQLERVGKAIERLDAILSVDTGASLGSSERAQSLEAPESDGDTEADGTESDVSLQPAA